MICEIGTPLKPAGGSLMRACADERPHGLISKPSSVSSTDYRV